MLASQFIQVDFPTVAPEDTLQIATNLYLDNCICHLAVVKNGNLLGILPAELVYDLQDEDKTVKDLQDDWQIAYVTPYMHGLEVFKLLSRKELSIVPVQDEDGNYVGTIPANTFLNHMGNLYSFDVPGGIIVLNVGARDYDLQEIARIISTNNAKILLLYLNTDEQNELFRLTIKVDTFDLSHILATFERYKYSVEYYYPSNPDNDSLRERYDLLMKLFDL